MSEVFINFKDMATYDNFYVKTIGFSLALYYTVNGI
jgi:hypothetical protein